MLTDSLSCHSGLSRIFLRLKKDSRQAGMTSSFSACAFAFVMVFHSYESCFNFFTKEPKLCAVFAVKYSAALRAMENLFIPFYFDKELGRYVHVASQAYFFFRLCYC